MSPDKMKVVALGGCGGMGQFAVRAAKEFDFVGEVVIADRVGERARAFAEQCGDKAGWVELDVTDSEALIKLLKDADVVLATVGPYFKFGVPVLRAAIEAGCDYLDICDDWEPTLEMLELDKEAKQARVTAVIGLGASPGISNLLASKAMNELDQVHEVITGWGTGGVEASEFDQPGEGGTYRAATEHWLHQITGRIRVRRDGDFVEAAPLQEVEVDYPGIGRVTTHTVGHPEPITIPMHMPQINNSVNVMNMPGFIIDAVKWGAAQVDAGRMSIDQATDQMMKIEQGWKGLIFSKIGRRLLMAYFRRSGDKEKFLPSIFALAIGTKDDKPAKVGAHMTAALTGGMKRENMGAATGIPLAVGLSLLHHNKIDKKGVFAPEMCINPDDFFNALAPLCDPPKTIAGDVLVVASSGNDD